MMTISCSTYSVGSLIITSHWQRKAASNLTVVLPFSSDTLPAAQMDIRPLLVLVTLSPPSECQSACFLPHPSTASLCYTNSY